jgi:predicted PurR-regulated permease PerM
MSETSTSNNNIITDEEQKLFDDMDKCKKLSVIRYSLFIIVVNIVIIIIAYYNEGDKIKKGISITMIILLIICLISSIIFIALNIYVMNKIKNVENNIKTYFESKKQKLAITYEDRPKKYDLLVSKFFDNIAGNEFITKEVGIIVGIAFNIMVTMPIIYCLYYYIKALNKKEVLLL